MEVADGVTLSIPESFSLSVEFMDLDRPFIAAPSGSSATRTKLITQPTTSQLAGNGVRVNCPMAAARITTMYSALNHHIGPLLTSIANAGGLDQYKYLIDAFRRTDTTKDEQFQRVYRSYWQMGAARLSDGFCNAYFGLLEELKAFDRTDVDSVAIRLFNIASNSKGKRKLHFSFSTKMVHMLQPDAPVYDSLVAQFYFLAEEGSTFDERLRNRLDSYRFLVNEYRRVLNEGLLAPSITTFRARFTRAPLSQIQRSSTRLSGALLRCGNARSLR